MTQKCKKHKLYKKYYFKSLKNYQKKLINPYPVIRAFSSLRVFSVCLIYSACCFSKPLNCESNSSSAWVTSLLNLFRSSSRNYRKLFQFIEIKKLFIYTEKHYFRKQLLARKVFLEQISLPKSWIFYLSALSVNNFLKI